MPEKTVLVADDAPPVRNVLKRNLVKKGFNVLTAGNGAEALSLARQHRPDLILLDLNMPETDGYEVLTELHKEGATEQIPVVVISAHGGEDEVRRAVGLGARDFIVKPFNLNSLLQKSFRLVYGSDEAPPVPPESGH